MANWLSIKKNLVSTSKSPKIKALTLSLNKQFQQVKRSLQQKKFNLLIERDDRPWILLTGFTEHGATQFLQHKNSTILSKHPTTGFTWLKTDDAIYVLGPSISPESVETIWPIFVRLLLKHRPKLPLNRFWLLLDPLILTKLPTQANYLTACQTLLQQLAVLPRQVPATVMINQLDYLEGFHDFFADLNETESQAPLGFIVGGDTQKHPIDSQFEQQYNQLLEALSRHLFKRLHAEKDLARRGLLKDFPVQFERLKPLLKTFITAQPWNDVLPLTGIYFTSSEQNQKRHSPSLSLNKAIIPYHGQTNLHTSRPYFIDGLIAQCLKPSIHHFIMQNKEVWKRLLSYPLAAIVVTLATMSFHIIYRHNVDAIDQMEMGLSALSATSTTEKDYWLKRLNILSQTEAHLQKRASGIWLGLDEANHLAAQTKSIYQHMLRKQFVPYLQQTLYQSLENQITANTPKLYQTLDIYLQLTHKQAFSDTENQQIMAWFATYWLNHANITSAAQQALAKHLQFVLSHNLLHIIPDQHVIISARTTLENLPTAEIALLQLQTQYHGDAKIIDNPHDLSLDTSHLTVPKLYDIKNFAHIYEVVIPSFVKNLTANNPVLGVNTKLASAPTAKLIQNIRATFLQQYQANWLSLLHKITFKPIHTTQDLFNALSEFSHKGSLLWQLCRVIEDNANLSYKLLKIGQPSNTISHWLDNSEQNKAFFQQLQQVQQNLHQALTAKNNANFSYNLAINHMNDNSNDAISQLQTLAQAAPAPIGDWLQTAKHAAWHLILKGSAKYLNTLWQQTVLPSCKTIVQNFPFNQNSPVDTPLASFSDFFGPNGTIDTFYSYYLKPFVDTSHFYWVWQQKDQQHLPLKQNLLENFQRANLIQQMFFADGSDTPQFNYSITPEGLTANVNQIMLQWGDQHITIDNQSSNAIALSWPNNGLPITIGFNLNDGIAAPVNYSGNWGLFRLINDNNLQTTNNAKSYTLLIQSGQAEASFKLTATSLINPFLPNIINKFVCPSKLS